MTQESAPQLEREPDREEAPGPPKRGLDRKKLARLVALAGVLAVALVGKSLVMPHIPVDRDVELRIESPEDVVGLDIRWSALASDEDITATSLRFPPRQAPSAVPADVRLPDGTYDVTITVERVSGVESTRRRITLDAAGRITIPLR